MARHNPKEHSRAPWYASNNAKIAFGVAGIVILVALLAFMNHVAAPATPPAPSAGAQPVQTQDGVQVVRMSVEGFKYSPSEFTVKAGVPVKWIVDGTRVSGCTSTLLFPTFGISRRLQPGENVIEFTPTASGTYTFHCGMDMVRGKMTVV